jgi:hypothetical protein
MGRRPEVRDASLMLGRTKRGGNEVRDASLTLGRTKRGYSAGQKKRSLGRAAEMLFQHDSIGNGRLNQTTFQTLSLRSVIKYTKSLLLNGFSEK